MKILVNKRIRGTRDIYKETGVYGIFCNCNNTYIGKAKEIHLRERLKNPKTQDRTSLFILQIAKAALLDTLKSYIKQNRTNFQKIMRL